MSNYEGKNTRLSAIEASNVEQKVLRANDVCRYLGIGRTKLHNLQKEDPSFPKKVIFTPRYVGWFREELDEWLNAKAEG